MQYIKSMAQVFADFTSLERAHFLTWASQAMDRKGPAVRDEQMRNTGTQLSKPEFEEGTWLVREMFGEMDRAEDARDAAKEVPSAGDVDIHGQLVFSAALPRCVKARGFERADNNGMFEVDLGLAHKVVVGSEAARALGLGPYDEETNKELGDSFSSGKEKYKQQEFVKPNVEYSTPTGFSFMTAPNEPRADCDECKGTGFYTSPVTAEKSACKRGCKP